MRVGEQRLERGQPFFRLAHLVSIALRPEDREAPPTFRRGAACRARAADRGDEEMGTHVAGGMTIQPAALGDLDAIEALEAAAFTGDRLSRRSLRAFVRAAHRPLMVARFGERVAGYALISTRRGGRAARIYSLAVDPRRGGAGLGGPCCRPASATRAPRDCETLRLEVRYDNSPPSPSTRRWAIARLAITRAITRTARRRCASRSASRRAATPRLRERRKIAAIPPAPLARDLRATHGGSSAGARPIDGGLAACQDFAFRSAREPIGFMFALGCEPAPRSGAEPAPPP